MKLIYKCGYDGTICNKVIPQVDKDGYVIEPEEHNSSFLDTKGYWEVYRTCKGKYTISGMCSGSLVIER